MITIKEKRSSQNNDKKNPPPQLSTLQNHKKLTYIIVAVIYLIRYFEWDPKLTGELGPYFIDYPVFTVPYTYPSDNDFKNLA